MYMSAFGCVGFNDFRRQISLKFARARLKKVFKEVFKVFVKIEAYRCRFGNNVSVI